MKKSFIMIILTTSIIILFPIINMKANESPPSLINIHSFEEDITGDGLKESVNLQGNYLSNDSSFFQQTTLDIVNSFHKEWNLSLKGGYEPELSFYDLNHDNVIDVLYEVAIDNKKEQYFTQAYTLKNDKVEQIDLPKDNPIKGIYRDNFRIELLFTPSKEKNHISIKNQEDLINDKTYNTKGEALEENYINPEPIQRYVPILISERKGYGLKSVQNMQHLSNNKIIGTLETLWYFDKQKNKWIILNTKWQDI